MRKGGYSRLGVFGTMNHYDNSGYKIGESRPGLFGSVNTYDSSGDRISRSDMNADAVSTPAGSGDPFAPANGGAPLVIDMSNIPSPDDFDDGAVW